jgi:hypothetical protein
MLLLRTRERGRDLSGPVGKVIENCEKLQRICEEKKLQVLM